MERSAMRGCVGDKVPDFAIADAQASAPSLGTAA